MTEIQLTDEQRQALQAQQGRPVEVIDPTTQQRYVLLAREQFEQVRALLEGGREPSPIAAVAGISPGMLRSQQAYWRDLPELLKQRNLHRQWVCYHGDDRIGIAKTDTELVQHCLKLGLQRGHFYVGRITRRDLPPWEPEEMHISLTEVTD